MTKAPRTLLVLKPGSFGDILHTLPAVARLKAAWPKCRISWLVNTEWMPLLAGNPDVDEVIEFPRGELRGWGGGWRAAKWLRAAIVGRRPDLALDFQGLLRSAVIGRASGARVLEGSSDAREGARWFYHRTVPSPAQPVHAVERYLTLADAASSGAANGDIARQNSVLWWRLPPGEAPESNLDVDQGYIVIHPYARGNHKSIGEKELSDLLRKFGTKKIVLVGRGKAAISPCPDDCVNLINRTTIPQLIWLVRRASFVVSVDSGPAHLAAALGKPMVAIHSWSDPRKVGPYHPDAWVWKNGVLAQVRRLGSMDRGFFYPQPLRLKETDLDQIARLAISPSDFSA